MAVGPLPQHLAGGPAATPSAVSPELEVGLAEARWWQTVAVQGWYTEAGRIAGWYEVASRPRLAPVSPSRPPVRPRQANPAPNDSGETTGVSCGGWESLVASLWPADQVRTACRILMCESGGNPYAYNRSGATGLFQLLGHGGTFDPVQNATVAHRLWLSSGWRPWVCR